MGAPHICQLYPHAPISTEMVGGEKWNEMANFLLLHVLILQLVIPFNPRHTSSKSSSEQLSSPIHNSDMHKMNQPPVLLTGTWPLMMTSSAKRTLTGLDFNLAFLAALMNADLGDLGRKKKKTKSKRVKDQINEAIHVLLPLHKDKDVFFSELSISPFCNDAITRA